MIKLIATLLILGTERQIYESTCIFYFPSINSKQVNFQKHLIVKLELTNVVFFILVSQHCFDLLI